MTLRDLYRSITRDTATHHRTITAQLERESRDRCRTVALYLRNLTDRDVGQRTHRSHGAARSLLRASMFAIFRRVHGVERYWKTGRPHPRADARQARAIAASMDVDGMPRQTPPGGPATARQALTNARATLEP